MLVSDTNPLIRSRLSLLAHCISSIRITIGRDDDIAMARTKILRQYSILLNISLLLKSRDNEGARSPTKPARHGIWLWRIRLLGPNAFLTALLVDWYASKSSPCCNWSQYASKPRNIAEIGWSCDELSNLIVTNFPLLWSRDSCNMPTSDV